MALFRGVDVYISPAIDAPSFKSVRALLNKHGANVLDTPNTACCYVFQEFQGVRCVLH